MLIPKSKVTSWNVYFIWLIYINLELCNIKILRLIFPLFPFPLFFWFSTQKKNAANFNDVGFLGWSNVQKYNNFEICESGEGIRCTSAAENASFLDLPWTPIQSQQFWNQKSFSKNICCLFMRFSQKNK